MTLSAIRSAACITAAHFIGVGVPPVWAEVPLATETAQTEQEGTIELSIAGFSDDRTRGAEVELGYAPLDNVEIELELESARDWAMSPATRLNEYGLSIKWLPDQRGRGLYYGFAAGISRELADDRAGEKETETETSLVAIFSYSILRGPHLHLNLGVVQQNEEDESETAFLYSAGFEYRIARRVTLTGDLFGRSSQSADTQIGLRYKWSSNVHLFANAGHGDDRYFGGIGVAFEFEQE